MKSYGGGGRTLSYLLAVAFALITCGAGAGTVVWNGSKGNGSLSDGDNWDGNAAPIAGDTLDFSAITSATTLNADFGDDRIFETVTLGTGVITMGGSLHVNTLTNPGKLAVPSGASLTVEGDINMTAAGTVLYSNEGSVTVKGIVYFNANSSFYEYSSVSASTQPIAAKGLKYNRVGGGTRVNICANANNDRAGMWILGSSGLAFGSVNNASYNAFTVNKGTATLYSSANWTLSKHNRVCNEIRMTDASSKLVIHTTDYFDGVTPRTVTISGSITDGDCEQGSIISTQNPSVVIKGNGKFVANFGDKSTATYGTFNHDFIQRALAIEDTATLEVRANKKAYTIAPNTMVVQMMA